METIVENRQIVEFNFYKNKKTMREQVLEILKNNEDAVKSDFILYLEYLKLSSQVKIKDFGEHIIIKVNKEDMLKITPPESISRQRRILHEDQDITYDEKTEKKRERAEKEFRGHYHKGEPLTEFNNQFSQTF